MRSPAGVRATVAASTSSAPSARSTCRGHECRARRHDVVDDEHGSSAIEPSGSTHAGPDRRDVPRPRAPFAEDRRHATRAVRRGNPGRARRRVQAARRDRRRARRLALAGTHVTVSIAIGALAQRAASCSPSQRTAMRSLRYFTRATSSRATPSYANAAVDQAMPTSAGANGAARIDAAHDRHTGSARRPQPGHRPGSST